MSETFITALLAQGLPGLVILALSVAVITLYKRVQQLTDKRAEDVGNMIEKYRAALEENTRTVDALVRARMPERRELPRLPERSPR